MIYLYYNVLGRKPGLFENWRHMVKAVAGWILFGLLGWAAIFEFVRW